MRPLPTIGGLNVLDGAYTGLYGLVQLACATVQIAGQPGARVPCRREFHQFYRQSQGAIAGLNLTYNDYPLVGCRNFGLRLLYS